MSISSSQNEQRYVRAGSALMLATLGERLRAPRHGERREWRWMAQCLCHSIIITGHAALCKHLCIVYINKTIDFVVVVLSHGTADIRRTSEPRLGEKQPPAVRQHRCCDKGEWGVGQGIRYVVVVGGQNPLSSAVFHGCFRIYLCFSSVCRMGDLESWLMYILILA